MKANTCIQILAIVSKVVSSQGAASILSAFWVSHSTISFRGGAPMKLLLVPITLVVLAACNPYMAGVTAVRETYSIATDERSVATQAADTAIEVQIKAALMTSPVKGTSGIDVYCRNGVVVLVGMVAPGSSAGREAVMIARGTSGVSRVETYFVNARPSWTKDFEIKESIRAVFVADPVLISGRIDIAVYGGHVVLVGVVPSRAKVDKFIEDARSVSGVVAVTSFIQVATN
jgi:osmotically-inducible protein OsmY